MELHPSSFDSADDAYGAVRHRADVRRHCGFCRPAGRIGPTSAPAAGGSGRVVACRMSSSVPERGVAAAELPVNLGVRSAPPHRQASSCGSDELEPPDASGAGATLFSKQIGHSRFGRPCRPRSCSDAKYTPAATSTRFTPPPKGNLGTLGIRRIITVHLPINMAAIGSDRIAPALQVWHHRAEAGPSIDRRISGRGPSGQSHVRRFQRPHARRSAHTTPV